MNTVTESIYSGESVVVPLADVQHIESWSAHSVPGIKVITRHTRWDREAGDWANSIWISEPEATRFKVAWCRYRSELEADTPAEILRRAARMAEDSEGPEWADWRADSCCGATALGQD